MRNYACTDYGLYVVEDDFAVYAAKNKNREGISTDFGGIIDDVGGNFYHGAEGECTPLLGFDTITVNEDEVFGILPLERSPTLCERAYNGYDEAIRELKANYGEYLPDDFDYERRLASFVGTVYS